MHVASLVNIHDVAVAVVEDQMAPAHAVHLAGKFKIVVPAERLGSVEFKNVTTAGTIAEINEGIVINVLIAQLSESVTACLMLDDTTGIERITIGTLRTEGNSRTVFPHLADATVIGRIRNDDDQRLIQIALVHGWSTQSITEYFVIVSLQSYATGKGGVESVVADGIHGSHARFRRKRNGCIDVEVITVSLVRFDTEEILHFLLDILQISAAGNILCVKAIAEQNDVDSTLVALGSLLQGNPFVLSIFIAILRNAAFVGVVFVFQSEHHLSITAIGIFRHSLDGQGYFCLLVAAGRRNLAPVWLAGYFPFAFGVNHQFLLMLRAQGAGYRWTANELMVGSDALEVAPAAGCLILSDG